MERRRSRDRLADASRIAERHRGNIASDWVTGLAPGPETIRAHITFTDGVRDAQPLVLHVVAPETPARKSTIIAQDAVRITIGNLGTGSTRLIPFTVPRAGRIDVSVDWDSFANSAGFFVWQGACSQKPCAGPLVIEAQTQSAKPRRASATVMDGDYTLECFAIGSGDETLRYEVRLTPD